LANEQLVVTNQLPEEATRVHKLERSEKNHLYFVELHPGEEGLTINGQIFKHRLTRIISVSKTVEDLHTYLGNHLWHVEKLQFDTLHTPKIKTELSLQASKYLQGQAEVIKGIVDEDSTIEVSADWLKDKLEQFSGAKDIVVGGTTTRIKERGSASQKAIARAWLRQELEAIGFEVNEYNYGRGTNLVAEKVGLDPSRYLIVSAHYDSVSNAGADDDGSGVISALAVAEALKDKELAVNLRIVAFDEEERGLLGSKAYASELNNSGEIESLVGVVNVEMTGYDDDGDGAFHVIDCNENSSADLTAAVMATHARGTLALKKVDACTNRSDHAAFWRYDKPAVVLSQNFFGGDSNPCYHRSCDTVANMNFDYMSKVTTLIVRSVDGMLRPVP
jgi:hypothetical protein